MRNYMITVKIPFECIDDFDARTMAKEIIGAIESSNKIPRDMSCKFQEIYDDKPPRGIQI